MNKVIQIEPPDVSQQKNKKQLYSCTRYSLYFKSSPRNSRGETQIYHNHPKKDLSLFINTTHPYSNNFTYPKYPLLKTRSPKHRQTKSMIGQDQKNKQEIKWIGVPKVDLSQRSHFSQRNIFPKRSAKGSNQLVLNLLRKCDKYLQKFNQQPIVTFYTKKDPQTLYRYKWIKHKKNRK